MFLYDALLSGRYDFAQIEIFTVNCADLSGTVMQRRGWLGEVNVQQDGAFVAEVRGLAQKLQCNIGELYSASCRAAFGDSRCKAPLGDYTHAGVVERVDEANDQQIFVAQNMGKPDGYFALCEITWLSGKNQDLRMEVKEFTNSQFVLALGMPHAIDKGDTFSAVVGCDKAFETCCSKFRNVVNFRGEPHIPGRDKLAETPGV